MHLRHIRPRSIEWYDALLEDENRGFDRLSPEEMTKLRSLQAAEQAPVVAFLRAPPQSTHATAR
jgi:hypothetical protein